MADLDDYDFRAREEALRALDAKLNQRRSELDKKAESLVREQEERLRASASNNVSSEDIGLDIYGDEGVLEPLSTEPESSPTSPSKQIKASESSQSGEKDQDILRDIHALEEEEGVIIAGGGMGSAATIRFQKARLKVLQEAVDKLQSEKQQLELKAQSSEQEASKAKLQAKRLKKTLNQTEQQIERHKQAERKAQEKVRSLEREIAVWRKDTTEAEKLRKDVAQNLREKEVKLNRALAMAEQARVKLQSHRNSQKNADGALRQEVAALKAQNHRLEQQRTELLAAFKKQFKLIDILRRQKLHVEAAKMLSFSEEEFSRQLELDIR